MNFRYSQVEEFDIWTFSNLDSSELLKIADEAKEAEYAAGNVDWLTVALEKAKLEKKDAKYTKRIK